MGKDRDVQKNAQRIKTRRRAAQNSNVKIRVCWSEVGIRRTIQEFETCQMLLAVVLLEPFSGEARVSLAQPDVLGLRVEGDVARVFATIRIYLG